jgi:DNA-directed RNA polymerase specialized sigma24 family protein
MQAPGNTLPRTSDRECLESWARHRDPDSLQTLVDRYLVFVHSSALRRTGDVDQAAEVTRAVFLVMARRACRLRKKTVLPGWLFHVTALACRKLKLKRIGRLRRLWHWISRKPRPALPPDATLWTRLAPQMDRALGRLRTKQRNTVLLCAFLNHDFASAAKVLRTSERRVEKCVRRGVEKLANRLGKRRAPVDPGALASACATEGCAATVPEGLSLDILQSLEASRGQRPSLELARRTLNALAWLRWRRRFVTGILTVGALITIPGGIAVYIDSFSGYSRLRSEAIFRSVRFWGWWQLTETARPWPTNAATPRLDARAIRNAQDLYRTTNIWHAHLRFTPEQWKALEFKRIGPMPHFARPQGLWFLRNPEARRSGIVGVLGFEFDWTHADFEFGGAAFTNVAARVKGNVRSLYEPTRAYKVDLNKFVPGQKLGGLDELTFNSLVWDYSCLGAALGYEFFRDAGVPAPRTAYAWLSTSVTTQWEQKPLGLFLMEEAVDNEFAAERFGSKAAPVFKPVTYKLFEHLGDEWPAYAPIYDLKTKATPEQQRRVIDFARLVLSATDAEFAAQAGDFLDLDEFARFLAGQVLLPCYDGILSDGQNFYMYLDPRSNKFGFIPWDLDSAWGNIWIASRADSIQASIWQPWIGENRFLERVMAVEEFRRIYRAHLEDFISRLYVPDRLHRRIDEIAAVIRDPIAAQSALRLDKFEQEVGWKPVHRSPGELRDSFNRPAHEMKRFIVKRAESVRRQLDGKSKGMILKYPEK